MLNEEVTREYAGALLEIGQEKNILDDIKDEIGFVSELIAEDRKLMLLFNSPVISKKEKQKFIDKAFAGNLSTIVVNFLKVIVENDRQAMIGDVHKTLLNVIDEANNIKRATVISSSKLDEGLLSKTRELLKDKFNKTIILDEIIDDTILGGIIFKIDDLVIDGSIKSALKKLKENLLISKINNRVAYED